MFPLMKSGGTEKLASVNKVEKNAHKLQCLVDATNRVEKLSKEIRGEENLTFTPIKFVIQKSYEGRERRAVELCINSSHGLRHGLIDYSDDPRQFPDSIPVGSVEFVEQILGEVKPDYYPDWASKHLHRNIYEYPNFMSFHLFVKPKNRYKEFEGQIDTKGLSLEFDCIGSQVVNFVDEWRYYIANGKVLCSWWYKGKEETCESEPNGRPLPFEIPEGFCGAIDMGLLDTGEFALVEVQHPYAIGWYGEMNEEETKKYTNFLIEGWKSLDK